MKKKTFAFFRAHRTWLLILCLLLCIATSAHSAKIPPLPAKCEAPLWLEASVRSALNAVWRELQNTRLDRPRAVEALALVAVRLFPGFRVTISDHGQVILRPERDWKWKTTVFYPESAERLPSPPSDWLKADIAKFTDEIERLVAGVPPEALRWSSESFQANLNALVLANVPGWRVSAHVEMGEGSAELEIKIYPQTPLLLAVAPETLSASFPQLLVDRINKKTLEYLSPLTGLPLDWISSHAEEITKWLGEKQIDSDLLKVLRAGVDNEISLKPVTKVTTRVESRTLSLRGWMSVHAGSDARFEAGAHLGHYFVIRSKRGSDRDRTAAEAYSEILMRFEHWRTDGRFGFRISPIDLIWFGIEETTEDDAHLWYRFWVDAPDKKSYGWLRYSDEDDLEMALGYHLTRYFSLELYYDDRQDDRVSVRAVGNL